MEQRDLLQQMAEVLGKASAKAKWEDELSDCLLGQYKGMKDCFAHIDQLVKTYQQTHVDAQTLLDILAVWATCSPFVQISSVTLKLDPHQQIVHDEYNGITFHSREEMRCFLERFGDKEASFQENSHSLIIHF